jgi:hypothetical protein
MTVPTSLMANAIKETVSLNSILGNISCSESYLYFHTSSVHHAYELPKNLDACFECYLSSCLVLHEESLQGISDFGAGYYLLDNRVDPGKEIPFGSAYYPYMFSVH